MIRTFIALELPPVVKKELEHVLSRLKLLSPNGVNWIKPENLHLTLLFIGDVPSEKIPEIETLLQTHLEAFPAFNFTAEGLEFFPAVEPRLLWLKLSCSNEDIIKLNRRLIRDLGNLGIEADRKTMKLHITLARFKTKFTPETEREIMQYAPNREPHSFSSISLFKSVLHPSGPQYTVLHKYNLKLTGG